MKNIAIYVLQVMIQNIDIYVVSQRFVPNLKKCFKHSPYIMWGAMSSFDDNMRCVEKWRVYNEQTVKQ
jgi:hypothetical protein